MFSECDYVNGKSYFNVPESKFIKTQKVESFWIPKSWLQGRKVRKRYIDKNKDSDFGS